MTDTPPDHHMLRRHMSDTGRAAIDQTYERYKTNPATTVQWARSQFRAYHGDLHEFIKGPLNARIVSRGQGSGFRFENVIFESHPGWEVNATLYLPENKTGNFPPVIVPVGHSGKQFENYQFPCQYFARAGFAAITFDPPGMAGEKQLGNDHFFDGVRCHLISDTSSRYFVGDVLRAMDYLETRDDIDTANGFACTGVSGGGHSSVFAALLDDRITAVAPSCCMTQKRSLTFDRSYSSCPEAVMQGRLRDGLDDAHLLAAIAPRPLLLMFGQGDEVFHVSDSRETADLTQAYYSALGASDQFTVFEDKSGHAYTLQQARIFEKWLKQIWNLPAGSSPSDNPEDYELLPVEALQCRPNVQINMRSITQQRAEILAKSHGKPTTSLLQSLVGIDPSRPAHQPVKTTPSQRTWFHDWTDWTIASEPGITIPITTVECPDVTTTLWHFNPGGRLNLARRGGLLMEAIGHLDRKGPQANLIAADLRGWGETAPATSPYENVNWGSPDRTLGYISISLDIAIESGRVRDAWQLQRVMPGKQHNVLYAVGSAGPVALHLAALTQAFDAVVLHDSPSSYMDLLRTEQFDWPHDIILPGVLKHYDLPLLAETTGCPVHWINPRDGANQTLSSETCAERTAGGLHYHHKISSDDHLALIRELLFP